MIAQQLENALAHIRSYGWCQGKYGGKADRCCLYGALYYANKCSAASVSKFVEEGLPPPPASWMSIISTWNDAPSRTQQEVEAKLEELIAKAKEQKL